MSTLREHIEDHPDFQLSAKLSPEWQHAFSDEEEAIQDCVNEICDSEDAFWAENIKIMLRIKARNDLRKHNKRMKQKRARCK